MTTTTIQTDLRSRIIRATDTIAVEHPVFLLCGQPGICKTSLAYSAKDPLLLDFDGGAYRAANRRDTWPIHDWDDVRDLMANPEILSGFSTIVPDTVGRCLDVMTADIIREVPKYGRDGGLTIQGFGVLKSRFRTWMLELRAMGKDVLLIAHAKEERDGDVTVLRAEITGGSYGEIMKVSDFIGTIYINGKNRVLDFNPNEKWIGKNPAGWNAIKIPPADKAQHFMEELFDLGRKSLGTISEASALLAQQVQDFRCAIDTYTTADELNRLIPDLSKLSAVVRPQVVKMLGDRALAQGIPWNKAAKQFTPAAEEIHA